MSYFESLEIIIAVCLMLLPIVPVSNALSCCGLAVTLHWSLSQAGLKTQLTLHHTQMTRENKLPSHIDIVDFIDLPGALKIRISTLNSVILLSCRGHPLKTEGQMAHSLCTLAPRCLW
uniref:Uncharacterized protein n=1 Tax=Blatta orientalis aliusvirus 1 TaxID=3133477 RepID=A0AAT9JH24_9VIRU